MSGNRLPAAVRIPSVIASQSGPEDDHQDSIVVEIPSSNKFAIEWPADSSVVGHAHLPVQAKERPVTLSSSEGETEISEEEHDGVRTRWSSRPEDSDAEFVTPTNNMDSDNNPMDQVEQPPTVPRLSRAFSMPLPSQLGFLQNPRRTTTPSNSSVSPGSEVLPELDCYQELSLELADSVQMVIQTLLQLSPPQILDPAKEQFSACSLSIPTPSMSAMFTSMKNLNYMSANMATISSDHQSPAAASALNKDASHHDFDVAEMLQNVGDVLSGVAAQAGVDLVLFHGDVGMKHVSAKGDESGISYTLSHIIRQVISVCERGDTVEIGLFIESVRDDDDPEAIRSTPSPNLDTSFRCLFHIAHRYRLTEAADGAPQRSEPQFSSLILRRLLRHVGAALEIEAKPRVPVLIGRSCELAIVFEPGEPSVLNPQALITPEDAALVGYPEYRIANEPSLEQLTTFAESLRGRKATLYANSRGSFAHHLSSYLTAWGMDVSHVSTEHDTEGERFEAPVDPLTPTPAASAPESTVPSSPGPKVPPTQTASFTFIMIDDDVNVLRNRLDKIKAELGYPLHLSRKRPSLASNHRPRSSPSVARFMGGFANSHSSPPTQYVIVHFTSLANYKLVKDAIQSLANFTGLGPRIPEVIVIPKPAGPRRFLTALHTAVTKPVVDPFFIPIATSPISPGLHGISPLFNFSNPARSPGGRSTGSGRTPSDRSTKSPKEPGDIYPHAPSSPLAGSDGMEYFSDSVGRLGTSPSTGLVIQSPDGQPAGIFFQPSAKGRSPSMASLPGHSAQTPRMEREYPKESHSRVRGGSVRSEGSNSFAQSFSEMSRPGPRPSVAASDSETTSTSTLKVKMVPTVSEELPPASSEQVIPPPEALPSPSVLRSMKRPNHPSPPLSPSQAPHSPATPGGTSLRGGSQKPGPRAPDLAKKTKSTTAGGTTIVPPISVLIVDDNPINQTILSTFMKKKKIKYDVAKNGEEAVQKWRSGAFHLILMDIQMPVMDGITATKEIRRLEKMYGTVTFPSTPQSEGQQTPSEASTSDSRANTTPYRSSVIIVALTASSLQADRVAALAAGCNDFLTKPVSLQWLNSKIIEWGSIKALQMYADIRPEVVKSFSHGQAQQAQNVARRLHVPEGRMTPTGGRSRSSSVSRKTASADASKIAARGLAAAERLASPDTPLSDDTPRASLSSNGAGDRHGVDPVAKTPVAQPEIPDTAPIHGLHDDRVDKLAERSGPVQPPATIDDGPPTEGSSSGPVSSADNPGRPPPEPQ